MTQTIRVNDSSVEKAIQKGLRQLQLTQDDVEIEVIDEGKKGLFGFGQKDAVVSITVKETIEQEENVYKRAHSFFLDKYEDYNNKTILVVCHGALIRIFLRELGLYPETKELIKNTALNILRFDGNSFILEKFNI